MEIKSHFHVSVEEAEYLKGLVRDFQIPLCNLVSIAISLLVASLKERPDFIFEIANKQRRSDGEMVQ